MAFDSAGNMYVAMPGEVKAPQLQLDTQTVAVVDPSGNWTAVATDPGQTVLHGCTNCAFGGPDMRDLYIANVMGDHFSRIRTPLAGHRLYHQR
jgi:sugar lactone lactonase YvrE